MICVTVRKTIQIQYYSTEHKSIEKVTATEPQPFSNVMLYLRTLCIVWSLEKRQGPYYVQHSQISQNIYKLNSFVWYSYDVWTPIWSFTMHECRRHQDLRGYGNFEQPKQKQKNNVISLVLDNLGPNLAQCSWFYTPKPRCVTEIFTWPLCPRFYGPALGRW